MDEIEAGVDLAVAETAVGFGHELVDLRMDASLSAGIVQRLRGVNHHEVHDGQWRIGLGLSGWQEQAGQDQEREDEQEHARRAYEPVPTDLLFCLHIE
jgi:hypothetical protein